MRLILRAILPAFSLIILLTGCKHSEDPFVAEKFDAFDDSLGQRVEAYHQTIFPGKGKEREGKPSLYIDFSTGIYQALSLPANQKFLHAVYDNLSGNVDVYKLSRDLVIPFTVSDLTAIGKQVNDKSNYKEIYAPIKKAVEEIVSKNNDAVLITDFEDYYPAAGPSGSRAEITNVAYLKESFINWLAKGNTIHFFISDYPEAGVTKHLFFAVFNYGIVSDESLLRRIENSVQGLSRFDLTNKAFTLSQNYEAEKTGGIFYDPAGQSEKAKNVLDLQKDKYINGLKKSNNFEFYSFGLDWKTIAEQREVYAAKFNDFTRKLFIDISNENSYRIDALSVKVSDVTQDFEQFSKCREAARHRPRIDKGSNGENKFADSEKDLIALNCYDPNGVLKEQWVYRNQPVTELPEVFTFNKTLFDNSIKNDGRQKAELAVSFDSRFNVKSIPSTARLLRIDIIIDKATASAANHVEKLSWTATDKKSVNSALSASITNALAEPKIKPDQQVIYSYYIKTLDN